MHRSQRQQGTPARSKNEVHARPIKPPERPLVPYMRYSRKMWPKVRAENPEVQLLEIGKIIGQMWREAADQEKGVYQQEYELDKVDYDRQFKGYQQAMANAHVTASRNRAATLNSSNGSSAAIQPVDEEDPYEMSRKRIAAIRYDRDSRLMSELFSSACLPDSRTIVPQNRIDQLKKQATSLSAHQLKLHEELNKLEENFQKRKRTLEENSEKFNEQIKKLKDEKPVFTEDKYREYVELWSDYYLDEFKKHVEEEKNQPPPEIPTTEEKGPEEVPEEKEKEEESKLEEENKEKELEKADETEEKEVPMEVEPVQNGTALATEVVEPTPTSEEAPESAQPTEETTA